MMNIFFDTEFTHLPGLLDLVPPGLVSIGCVSQNDTKFYAENANFQVELCSNFTTEVVLPFLEGGDVSMPYQMVSKQLKEYIENFESEVTMWCDSPYHDWPFIEHMFDHWGWPSNLAKKPSWHTKDLDFITGVEQAFNTFVPKLRRHHALDDAIANRYGFLAQKMCKNLQT